jgi:hypothetical protein
VSTWIKLHDNFWRHPKVLAAGEDAGTLYVQGLCYCSDGLTDGRIPTAALRTLTAKKDARTLARILVREGLWIETPHGWEVHGYLEIQRSREQVERERERWRTSKAKSRGPRESPRGNPSGSPRHVPPSETEAETDNPTPTPPPLSLVTDPNGYCLVQRDTWRPGDDGKYQLAETETYCHGNPHPRIDPSQLDHLRATRAQTFGGPDA